VPLASTETIPVDRIVNHENFIAAICGRRGSSRGH
jgi:hypothetical protein